MAKIHLEDMENDAMRVEVDATGEELINMFANAFLKNKYLRVAAARGLSDCIMHEYLREENNEHKNSD